MNVRDIIEKISKADAEEYSTHIKQIKADINRDEAAKTSSGVNDWLRVDNNIEDMAWRIPLEDELERLEKRKLRQQLQAQHGSKKITSAHVDAVYTNLKKKNTERLLRHRRNHK